MADATEITDKWGWQERFGDEIEECDGRRGTSAWTQILPEPRERCVTARRAPCFSRCVLFLEGEGEGGESRGRKVKTKKEVKKRKGKKK
jgi:hypothetical protein